MKKDKIILIVLLLVVIVLCIVAYIIRNKKIETNIRFEDSPIISGDMLDNNSGEIIDSGEVLGLSEQLNDNSGDKIEIKQDDNDNNTKKNTNSNNTQKLTSNTPYYIKINNSQNVVTIYAKDAEEKYTIPYKAMVCSVGTDTPDAGKSYKITSYKRRWNALQGNVYGQYATQIIGNILFHSVPYTSKSNSALEYWEYDKLGTAASLGCVRLTVEDAKWIYDNIATGTIVEFYEDDNPGPLRKAKS